MFDCNVTVLIRHPVRGADGELAFLESTSGALLIERRVGEYGSGEPERQERTVLLLPAAAEVAPGDRCRCGEEEFELGEVRVCRDLDGAVVAYRCRVVR